MGAEVDQIGGEGVGPGGLGPSGVMEDPCLGVLRHDPPQLAVEGRRVSVEHLVVRPAPVLDVEPDDRVHVRRHPVEQAADVLLEAAQAVVATGIVGAELDQQDVGPVRAADRVDGVLPLRADRGAHDGVEVDEAVRLRHLVADLVAGLPADRVADEPDPRTGREGSGIHRTAGRRPGRGTREDGFGDHHHRRQGQGADERDENPDVSWHRPNLGRRPGPHWGRRSRPSGDRRLSGTVVAAPASRRPVPFSATASATTGAGVAGYSRRLRGDERRHGGWVNETRL